MQLLYIVATNSCHTHSPLHCYLRPPYIVATYNRHKQLPYTHTITPLVLKLRYTGVIYSRHTRCHTTSPAIDIYTSHVTIHSSYTTAIQNRHTQSSRTVLHVATTGARPRVILIASLFVDSGGYRIFTFPESYSTACINHSSTSNI